MSQHRTPLGRARGMGSAKSGATRFIAERVSGAALAVLGLWGVAAAMSLRSAGFDGVSQWLREPVNLTLLSLLAAVSFYHMRLGLCVVVEDYIDRPITKAVLLTANTFVCVAGAALTLVCLFKVAFGGGAS